MLMIRKTVKFLTRKMIACKLEVLLKIVPYHLDTESCTLQSLIEWDSIRTCSQKFNHYEKIICYKKCLRGAKLKF